MDWGALNPPPFGYVTMHCPLRQDELPLQTISGASTTAQISFKNTAVDEVVNITKSRVLRALRHDGPF
jgi:hypothetical protein